MEKEKKYLRTKERSEDEKKMLKKRLNILEGQIVGLKKMIDEDRYCDDILIQISAINKSLKSFGNVLLKNHLTTCVAKDLRSGRYDVVDDVVELFNMLNK